MTKVLEDSDKQNNGFLFYGGVLALDLVNTEKMVRGKRGDLLTSPQALQSWWEAVLAQNYTLPTVIAPEVEFDEKALAATKDLRASLRQLFTAVVGLAGATQSASAINLEKVNQVLASGSPILTTNAQGEVKAAYQLQPYPLQQGRETPLLFQVALSALQLLTSSDLERLHQCKSARCILYFYDHTKSSTRQWCSLGCMNRARSIEHYKHTKQIQQD
jgi:predicted RNA-binding Zn ribbon-like protein